MRAHYFAHALFASPYAIRHDHPLLAVHPSGLGQFAHGLATIPNVTVTCRQTSRFHAANEREALREDPENDEADAEAICESVTRPTCGLQRRERRATKRPGAASNTSDVDQDERGWGNNFRAYLAEFGITESIRKIALPRRIEVVISGDDDRLRYVTRAAVTAFGILRALGSLEFRAPAAQF
jgi:hypothetical protein